MTGSPAGRSAPSLRLVLSLVSHTNVGKTTLARTLLRRDVGEVFDQAHVTDQTETFVLLERDDGAQVLLADTPGFGDSARLLRRLRGMDNPLGWLLAQVWDRFAARALFCSQQAVRHVRDESDAVLYLVNASEDPDAAGYVAAELEILDWTGRPTILLLNQTGAPADASSRAADEARWRAHAATHSCVREVLSLDAFTRCWVQEGALLEHIRDALPLERRELAEALLDRWRELNLAVLDRSVEAMADLLARAAADGEPVGAGRLGRAERRRATEALASRLEELVAATNDQLIGLHGLTGEAAEELRVGLEDVSAPGDGPPPWRRGVLGGIVGGALGGLAADLATGGLSFGGGAVAGAILGAAGLGGLAWGFEWLGSGQTPRIAWSPEFLERLWVDTSLRYLAVAHSGRGAGAFRAREPAAAWRDAVRRALAPQREALRAAVRRARSEPGAEAARQAGSDLRDSLGAAVRSLLAGLYPESAPLLAARSGAARST